MKIIISIIVVTLLNMCFAFADRPMGESFEVIGKITLQENHVRLFRSSNGDAIPSVLQRQHLKEIISQFNPNEEAIIKGHITYLSTSLDGQASLRPFFIIESIKPISLQKLGKVEFTDSSQFQSPIMLQNMIYAPMALPITTEVASAITLTTSMLLMQSLATSSRPQVTDQLNTGLILFAGALATGVFIFEQITGTQTKDNSK
jgi:hypothetical protein